MKRRLRHLVWRLAEPPAFLPPFAVQSIKVALASGLAWGLGQALHSPKPFNAVLAVIILMQVNAYGSLLNALEFVAGIAAGLVLGILAERLVGLSPPVLAAIIFICMLIGGWVKSPRNGLNNQIAISALLVLASGSSENVDRLWETVLGGLIGVAVAALVWPPNPVRRLRHEYHVASERIKADVRRTVEIAGGRGDPEENRRRVRANSEHADEAVAAIAPAEDALRWNPWHRRRMHDLGRLEDRLRLISYLYRTVRALARQAAEAPPPAVVPGAPRGPSPPHPRGGGGARWPGRRPRRLGRKWTRGTTGIPAGLTCWRPGSRRWPRSNSGWTATTCVSRCAKVGRRWGPSPGPRHSIATPWRWRPRSTTCSEMSRAGGRRAG